MADSQPFQPWKEPVPYPTLSAVEPPCKGCAYWNPIPLYTYYGEEGMIFEGVRLCHASEMQFDFSCFKAKGAK